MMSNNFKKWLFIFSIAFSIRLIVAIFYLNFDSHALTLMNEEGRRPFLPFGKLSSNIYEVVGDRDGYNSIARNIAFYGRIGQDKYYLAHPPLYPIFLAIFYRLFGCNVYSFLIPQVALDAINAILILFLAECLFNNKRLSIMASLLYVFNPHSILTSIQLYSETLYLFLLLVMFLSLKGILSKPTAKNSIVTGVVMGLTALCRSVFLVFIPFIFIWLTYVFIDQKKKLLIITLGAFLSFALICSIWIIRNYRIFNRPLFSIDYSMVLAKNMPVEAVRSGGYSKILGSGGVLHFINWVRNNPRQYFEFTKTRFKLFIFKAYPEGVSRRNKIVSSIIFYVVFPLGCLGIIAEVIRKQKLSFLILLYILSTAVLHILTGIDSELRYRYPIEVFMGIFACYGVSLIGNLWGRLQGVPGRRSFRA